MSCVDFTLKPVSSTAPKPTTEYENDANRVNDIAREQNLDIFKPKPNQLLLDFDTPTVPTKFFEQLEILNQFEPVLGIEITTSRGGNQHVYVNLGRRISNEIYRIGLQAMMGSDLKRELLGIKKTQNALPYINFLYERKTATRKIILAKELFGADATTT